MTADDINQTITLVNGELSESISVMSRGLAYGDGLFETMRVVNGVIPLWELHSARLWRGLSLLKISCQQRQIFTHLDASLKQIRALPNQQVVLKLMVIRGQGGKAYIPASTDSDLISIISPLTSGVEGKTGVEVHLCSTTLPEPLAWAGLKTLNQLPYVIASGERFGTHYQEGLMGTSAGEIIEATARNLFICKDNKLYTPSLEKSGVAGVMRALILDYLAAELEIDVLVTSISAEDLKLAEEIFLSNSVTGIWPVIAVENQALSVGQTTKKIQLAVEQFIANNSTLAYRN